MSKFIKLDPTKPFEIPKGFRLGKVIINGKCGERSIDIFENTTVEDDNRFIRKLQTRMLHRSIEWIRRKIIK